MMNTTGDSQVDDLLDYVLEKDLEDTAARVIMRAVREMGGAGKRSLCHFLRGKKPYMFRNTRSPHNSKYASKENWGRLSQFDDDQVYDRVESLVRLGMLHQHPLPHLHSEIVVLSDRGDEALRHMELIPMMIPWPLPKLEFPAHQPFHKPKRSDDELWDPVLMRSKKTCASCTHCDPLDGKYVCTHPNGPLDSVFDTLQGERSTIIKVRVSCSRWDRNYEVLP